MVILHITSITYVSDHYCKQMKNKIKKILQEHPIKSSFLGVSIKYEVKVLFG